MRRSGGIVLTLALALLAVAQPLDAAWATCKGGYAQTVKISGEVETPKEFDLAALEAKASADLQVAYYSGGAGFQTYAFTGVPLINLLDEAGVITDPNQKNDILRKYVVVTGSDCYQAVVSLAELLPTFAGQPILVAYADGTGMPLPADQGMARLVVPGDKAGGRYVSNIVSIVVRTPGAGPQTKH